MIDVEDLMQPTGRITAAMFPDDTPDQLEERLQAYLDAAYVKLAAAPADDQDAGAEAYAYFRAYDAAADALTLMPQSASLQGLGSIGFSASAIAEFRRIARDQLAVYEGLVPISEAPSNNIPPSGAMKTVVRW